MAWTYAAYMTQSGTPAQIAMCKQFIAELMTTGGASLSAGDRSISKGDLNELIRQAREDLKWLMGLPDATGAVAGGVSHARLRSG